MRPNDPLQWLVNAGCYVAGRRSAALPPGSEVDPRIGPALVLSADVPIGEAPDSVAVAPSDAVVRLAFTSGMTGPAKGVELTSGALGAVALALRDTLPWPERPQVLCAESVSGGFGNMVLPTFLLGGSFALPDEPGVDSFLDAVVAGRPTVLMMMPPILRAVLNHPRADSVDWSSVELVVYSGASLESSEVDRAHAVFGEVLCQVFGQVEVPKTIAYSTPADHRGERRSALGRPFPGTEIRLCGPSGTEVPAGQAGELWVRGPTIARSYAFPAGSPVHDGWLRTGDVCRMDSAGYLYYVDRVQYAIPLGDSYLCPSDLEERVFSLTGQVVSAATTEDSSVRFVPGAPPRDVMGRPDRRGLA
ncbi:class I adenylate-forming enzyme family protein [Amycolatopsis jejuensis]|uniref:class I adenylate-forming enzyme family protein n=1 Tax=Amycolatopsis jejuensis TaxID=330084 RepID=UPI0012E093A6|nr:AMP-binding protein [Amycolatopsis jejuensis]